MTQSELFRSWWYFPWNTPEPVREWARERIIVALAFEEWLYGG